MRHAAHLSTASKHALWLLSPRVSSRLLPMLAHLPKPDETACTLLRAMICRKLLDEKGTALEQLAARSQALDAAHIQIRELTAASKDRMVLADDKAKVNLESLMFEVLNVCKASLPWLMFLHRGHPCFEPQMPKLRIPCCSLRPNCMSCASAALPQSASRATACTSFRLHAGC